MIVLMIMMMMMIIMIMIVTPPAEEAANKYASHAKESSRNIADFYYFKVATTIGIFRAPLFRVPLIMSYISSFSLM